MLERPDGGVDVFRPYAELADGLAARELETVPRQHLEPTLSSP